MNSYDYEFVLSIYWVWKAGKHSHFISMIYIYAVPSVQPTMLCLFALWFYTNEEYQSLSPLVPCSCGGLMHSPCFVRFWRLETVGYLLSACMHSCWLQSWRIQPHHCVFQYLKDEVEFDNALNSVERLPLSQPPVPYGVINLHSTIDVGGARFWPLLGLALSSSACKISFSLFYSVFYLFVRGYVLESRSRRLRRMCQDLISRSCCTM